MNADMLGQEVSYWRKVGLHNPKMGWGPVGSQPRNQIDACIQYKEQVRK